MLYCGQLYWGCLDVQRRGTMPVVPGLLDTSRGNTVCLVNEASRLSPRVHHLKDKGSPSSWFRGKLNLKGMTDAKPDIARNCSFNIPQYNSCLSAKDENTIYACALFRRYRPLQSSH